MDEQVENFINFHEGQNPGNKSGIYFTPLQLDSDMVYRYLRQYKPKYEPLRHQCIIFAYQWLAAQKRVKNPSKFFYLPLKHVIEAWAGHYVSEYDVVAAAQLLGLKGEYPNYNISKKLTSPDHKRVEQYAQFMTMKNYCDNYQIKNKEVGYS